MFYLGLISGTSMDGIDSVLVDFSKQKPDVIGKLFKPYSAALKKEIFQLVTSDPALSRVANADYKVGLAFSECALELLEQSSVKKEACLAIGSHGQNIYHHPSPDSPTSIQIGDPNVIAEKTGITTVADFRRRDIAAGGQGAPLAPAFHEFFFLKKNCPRVILNIGGISNITVLPGDPKTKTIGFDCGPGNTLMDIWSMQHLGKEYDESGTWAASGKVNTSLLAEFLADDYFLTAPPKSTGREHFNSQWLKKILKNHPSVNTVDVQSTLCELTATCCVNAIQDYAGDTREIIVCGGGVHNAALLARLDLLLKLPGCTIKTTADYGIDPDIVEAIAFAWLAKQTIENLPSNLPAVTGASHPVILGGVYKS